MTQPPYYPQTFPYQPVPRLQCAGCGSELAPALLACPRCQRLVHSDRLNALAAEARAAGDAGDFTGSLVKWREALELLPVESRQHGVIRGKIDELTRKVDATGAGDAHAPRPARPGHGAAGRHAGSALGKALGVGGAAALLLWKFKFAFLFLLSKGKLLLLGLTKGGTVVSMLLSVGAYWAVFGWKFAVGIVLSIYVHEMGHVAMLTRYGVKATAPMFIPGLGAFIRLKQYPASPREEARVGLAGPIWGLGAAAAAYGTFLLTGWSYMAAIAVWGARINLFNLAPVWQLDGSHGFAALSRKQRWIVLGVMGGMLLLTTEGMLVLLLPVMLLRLVADRKDPEGDRWAFYTFMFLVVTLSLLAAVRVPGVRI